MSQQWFDPVILSLGPLQIRWYGLMYVIGFMLGGWLLGKLSKSGFWPLPKAMVDKYVTAMIIGMFLGARTFYVFIYNWDYYSSNLLEALQVWHGGLSFHGALVGMIIATAWFARKHHVHFFQISDSLALVGTPGLFFGRMGNFINGELYGRMTDGPFGIIFPGAGPYPRHPSQLYEGLLEGLVLTAVLWLVHRKQRNYGLVSTLFMFGYGLARFIVEFFREPDAQLGYYAGGFTMGQILCFLMMLSSILVWVLARRAGTPNPLASGTADVPRHPTKA